MIIPGQAAIRASILVIDDRPDNLLVIEAVFKDYPDYQLVTAQSGPEAIDRVKEQEFALILLDIQMPGMDGYETAKRIKELPNGKNVPIMLISAIFTEDPHILKGYSAGAIDYICKPFNPDVLKAKVDVYAKLYIKSRQVMMFQNKTFEELEKLYGGRRKRPRSFLKSETGSDPVPPTSSRSR